MMVGDGHNDVPALQIVGYPVAMGNAPDDVADAARHRVAHVDHDGVAEALDRAVATHQP
jgi:hydroxymethylpyrimidine pyrophosphatase-like HAD family hydrolase